MHNSWQNVLKPLRPQIDSLLRSLSEQDFAPASDQIFRALELPIDDVRVIILGQDPYPTKGMAEGLAFSVPPDVAFNKLPPSLKNIFREYESDCGLPPPPHGHLGRWMESGVLLLNRILTVRIGAPLSHQGIGWESVTDLLLTELSHREIPIMAWGASAQRAALQTGFSAGQTFAAPHPSPLSAYRGFFGSRPFSQVNHYLHENGKAPIDWRL